jgi:hypothetical protein
MSVHIDKFLRFDPVKYVIDIVTCPPKANKFPICSQEHILKLLKMSIHTDKFLRLDPVTYVINIITCPTKANKFPICSQEHISKVYEYVIYSSTNLSEKKTVL